MKLRHLLGAFLALFFVLGTATAASAQYGATTGNGTVDDGAVPPGECVTFGGDGFAPGSEVTISDNGTTVGTVDASLTGTFSTEVCPEVLGVHILRGTGVDVAGNQRVVTARVVVSNQLSVTGSSSTVPALLAGLGLVVAGSGTVLAGSRIRRRRRLAG